LSITADEEVGLWKFTDGPNFADAYAGCNIYSCINIDRLQQLLKSLLDDHRWEWVVGFLNNIDGHEMDFNLIEE
jgi:hypothetical protein